MKAGIWPLTAGNGTGKQRKDVADSLESKGLNGSSDDLGRVLPVKGIDLDKVITVSQASTIPKPKRLCKMTYKSSEKDVHDADEDLSKDKSLPEIHRMSHLGHESHKK